jgi:hypothetical protein
MLWVQVRKDTEFLAGSKPVPGQSLKISLPNKYITLFFKNKWSTIKLIRIIDSKKFLIQIRAF